MGNVRFGRLHSQFLRKSRGKRSFWKASFPVFAKVSWNTLVLEVWILTFGESLMQNAPFGVDGRFLRKSRGKRSFWMWIKFLGKVSWKTLVVEEWIVRSVDCHFLISLVENARIGSVDRHFLR